MKWLYRLSMKTNKSLWQKPTFLNQTYLTSKFCTSSDKSEDSKNEVPLDFYDDIIESEKEALDLKIAFDENKLENITTLIHGLEWEPMEIPKIELNAKDILTYEEEEENEDENQDKVNDGNKEEYEEEYEDEEEFDLLNDMLLNDDVSNHIDKFRKIRFFPEEMLNYNHPWRKKKSFSDPYLRKFIPFTSRAKFRHDKQGLRHCTGGMQRKGLSGILNCHKIDLDSLHYLDVLGMRRFLTFQSRIKKRHRTGLCARCQRQVAKTIKRARNLGILPHQGEFLIWDSKPSAEGSIYHNGLDGKDPVISKSILR